jgi:hypothetical protein
VTFGRDRAVSRKVGWVDVGQIASELYGLRLDEFTAARNARSKQLAADGDRKLAAEVRAIAKASVAAWAINGFATVSDAAHREYADLGNRLRAVQAHPDRATLTQLVGERRSLISNTVKAVSTLAAQHGIKLRPGARS